MWACSDPVPPALWYIEDVTCSHVEGNVEVTRCVGVVSGFVGGSGGGREGVGGGEVEGFGAV